MKMFFFLIRKIAIFTLLIVICLVLTFCRSGKKKANLQKRDSLTILPIGKTDNTDQAILVDAITLSTLDELSEFPNAKLEISKITAESDNADSALLQVNYTLSNFKLTDKTNDENAHVMANSTKGQHIHFILDNEPYTALYEPKFQVKLKKGTRHYLLSFLSRSYHESIKQPEAAVLKHFEITEKGEYLELPLDTTAMLFYSRPKGEYKGVDSESVLLDFYLWNALLGKDTYKLKVNINDKEFIIDNWQAHKIMGLPLGESKLTLTLLDKNENPIETVNTTVSRKIVLTE